MKNNEDININNNAKNIKRAVIKLSGRVQGVGFRPFVFRLAEKYGVKGYVLNNIKGVEIDGEGKENDLTNFIKSLDSDKPPLAIINNKIVEFTKPIFYKDFKIKESDKTENYRSNVNKTSGGKSKSRLNLTIPPDIAICGKCLKELLNPFDRRYLYPFINCTDCGPRFTISKDMPYDRTSTVMNKFKMCLECESEYKNPSNRRFHAEPNGCFICGPEVKFILNTAKIKGKGDLALSRSDNLASRLSSLANIEEEGDGINKVLKLKRTRSLDAVKSLVELIKGGGIACVKGIGGFHLMADATNDNVLKLLRKLKNRPKKPFAVMFKDINEVLKYAYADNMLSDLITSKERPIVLLKDKENLSYYVNCGLKDIGVFLPYAPIHYIIFSLFNKPLVATSANIGGEPIIKDNDEAIDKLKNIADGFLIHNRDILRRCDDSVIKVTGKGDAGASAGNYFFIRRSRGYVPEPVKLPFNLKRNVLAAGAFLKNTFALAYTGAGANADDIKNEGAAAILSQHNGDLDNVAGFANFKKNIEDFERFYDFKPDVIVYDSHPAYENTKWAKDEAKEKNIKSMPLQHHRAHIISCMAENGLGLNEEVLGIAFDGTGYGDDGTIWGGEFFKGNYTGLKRAGSFKKFRLLGGDKAVKSPQRILLSILFGLFFENGDKINENNKNNNKGFNENIVNIAILTGFSIENIKVFLKMWKSGINSPFTSSCGRIFDAVSCLCGFKGDISYEGEAAMYLEDLCGSDSNEKPDSQINKADFFEYGIGYNKTDDLFIIDYNPMFNQIVRIIISNYNYYNMEDLKTDGNITDYKLNGKVKISELRKLRDGLYKNIAGRFVNTLILIIKDMALRIGCKNVCMSGGVFQNAFLRYRAARILKGNGFNTFFNKKIPTNDGGISFGQAVYGGIIVPASKVKAK